MRPKLPITVLLIIASLTLGPRDLGALSGSDVEMLFVREVLPLLKTKCFACHGDDPAKIQGDLDIRSRQGLLDGGVSGPVLVPGIPQESLMYLAVTWEDSTLEMPPKANDRLSNRQIGVLEQWIAAGAAWPIEERRVKIVRSEYWNSSDGITVATSGGLSDEWSNRRYNPDDLWAYSPVRRYPVPSEFPESDETEVSGEAGLESGNSRPGNPIDSFVNRKLKEAGIKPAGLADKLTLIRRATFDLTGLPPTPEEIEAFLEDDSAEAYKKVVNRLLNSPRYGERWGRHWLDVVRYADTSGFSNDFERPNAWRYRDYVVRSFNADKPYSRFIVEQIAGDELDPNNPEMLIAVGYLRMGPWEHTGMSVAAVTRQYFLDDISNSLGETFLSIPLRCARCHDHKFDPIPTKDYYRIQATFAPMQIAEREVSYLPAENQGGFKEGRTRLESLLEEARRERDVFTARDEKAAKEWMEERGLEYVSKKDRINLPEVQRPPRFGGLTLEDLGVQKALGKRIQRFRWNLDRYKPIALSVYNGPSVKHRGIANRLKMPENRAGIPESSHILDGGSVYGPGEQVTPGVLSAVHGSNDAMEPSAWNTIPDGMDGRRLALANWIASPNNPLSTRSIVNRIWQWHFGDGIAGNTNNFGVMGKNPTHPELLDWLTQYFVEHGWSFKTMHKLVMTSNTYQRSGRHPDMKRVKEIDPDGKFLSSFRPRRLTAEEIRDGMLLASGELNLEMGGFPIFPEMNMEVALQPRHVMGSMAPAHQPSRTPEMRNRRTIYAYRYRGLPDPMLEVFNQPTSDVSCERRTESSVTPQVFTLFNSQNSYDRSLAMANRIEQEAETVSGQIARAFKIGWGREPTMAETSRTVAYLEEATAYHMENPPTVKKYPALVKRNMFEEMTGEPFEFIERLDVYEDYVPGLKPWDVQPETRALADLCLVLFNANEFIYVY